MTTLGSVSAAEILQACEANASEIAAAFTRAFSVNFEVSVGQPTARENKPLSADLATAGLAICLQVHDEAMVLLLPEACGLIPAWYAQPDPTGQSKLTTLAQELGMLLLPESLPVSHFKTERSLDLARWFERGEAGGENTLLPLELTDEEGRQGTAQLIWSLHNPAALLSAESGEADEPAEDGAQASPHSRRIPASEVQLPEVSEHALPNYSRSLLRIKVPVTVTLAEKRQAVGWIVELGPGSIIQFDKPCEELLELEVGGHKIGRGEAVKVGDKFGLRVTSLIVPDERFVPLSRANCG